ncbi:MAG: M48 family metallopeptidase [Treponema sp.]|jgi:predicted metal-dependent hydrolase|nr:M48 family metallopeptidase [Treponema sp.]
MAFTKIGDALVEKILVKDIPVEISRRKVRSIRLTVHPDCRVTVSAPHSIPAGQVYSFIESKYEWLKKHLVRYREKERKSPGAANNFISGEVHYVWGSPYTLEVTERRGHPKITLTPGIMNMFVRPGSTKAQKQALLDKWRKELVAQAAPPLINKWQKPLAAAAKKPALGVQRIYLQKMKTHWGSCNNKARTIRLNTELAAKPPEYLDYVVLHEMVHLVVPSHNRVFYAYMDSLMPEWKDIRRKMNRGDE